MKKKIKIPSILHLGLEMCVLGPVTELKHVWCHFGFVYTQALQTSQGIIVIICVLLRVYLTQKCPPYAWYINPYLLIRLNPGILRRTIYCGYLPLRISSKP